MNANGSENTIGTVVNTLLGSAAPEYKGWARLLADDQELTGMFLPQGKSRAFDSRGEFANEFDLYGPPPPNPVLQLISAGLWFAVMAFWLWMLIECFRNEHDRRTWLWAFVLFGFIGFQSNFILPLVVSTLYFVTRWLPHHQLKLPGKLRQLTNRRKLMRLEIAAKQIGNAHQFVQWGDALRDVGQIEKANSAYDQALEKEPDNLQALWGSGLTFSSQSEHAIAKERFEAILNIDPKYKFGDVSMEFGKSMVELNQVEAALAHMREHIKRWRHPEGMFVLAKLEMENGDNQAAKELCDAIILDVDGSPKGIARRHSEWRTKARKLLGKL